MANAITRRAFVGTTVATVGLSELGFLRSLSPIAAAEARLAPDRVQLSPDIEPLVQSIENTERGKLLDAVAAKIREGASYQQLLAALFLAGVRGIKPRPVGFKFHAVLVVNSAHLASLAAADQERWLPLFWALDNFKVSQARNQVDSAGWVMPPVEESRLPASHQAKEQFIAAMDNWDVEGADSAIAAFARHGSAIEVIEAFWRFGARDFRDIGHKAIYVANSWRTLQAIGWRHAEPVLRSLAFALLEHEGDNPAKRDGDPDRPWRENLPRVKSLRRHWQAGKQDAAATAELLDAIRTGSASDASARVVTALNRSVDPASLWDGVFLGAGELLARQPGIVGLHCVTTANALYYAYQTTQDETTRAMMLLQAVAFLPLFREAMKRRGNVRDDLRLDRLEPLEAKGGVEEVFADVSKNREVAARKALGLLAKDLSAGEALIAAGRRLVFSKGLDSHDYKFSSALLEDYYHTTPGCRGRFLASGMFHLKGAGDRDNELIKRVRAALPA
jgi:hypothetical protein